MKLKIEPSLGWPSGSFVITNEDGWILAKDVSPELAAWIVAKAELEIEMCVCGVALDAPDVLHHGRHTPVRASREVEFGPALTEGAEIEI